MKKKKKKVTIVVDIDELLRKDAENIVSKLSTVVEKKQEVAVSSQEEKQNSVVEETKNLLQEVSNTLDDSVQRLENIANMDDEYEEDDNDETPVSEIKDGDEPPEQWQPEKFEV